MVLPIVATTVSSTAFIPIPRKNSSNTSLAIGIIEPDRKASTPMPQ